MIYKIIGLSAAAWLVATQTIVMPVSRGRYLRLVESALLFNFPDNRHGIFNVYVGGLDVKVNGNGVTYASLN